MTGPSPDALIRQALIFRGAGENAKAIDLLKEALAADPLHLNGQIQLGATYLDQGKTGLALDTLAGAARQAPSSPVVHRLVALGRLQQGALPEARKEAEEAIRLYAGDAISHTILGRIFAQQRNWADALRAEWEGERQALPLAAQDLAQNTVKLVTEGW